MSALARSWGVAFATTTTIGLLFACVPPALTYAPDADASSDASTDEDGGADGAASASSHVGCGGTVTCEGLKCCTKPSGGSWYYPTDDAGQSTPCKTTCAPFYGYDCDDPTDCPSGRICCARRNDTTGAYSFSLCTEPSACAPDATNLPLCQPGATTSVCPSGLSCRPGDVAVLPPGYYVCQ